MFKIQAFSSIAGKFVDTLHAPGSFASVLAIANKFQAAAWRIINPVGKVVKTGKPE